MSQSTQLLLPVDHLPEEINLPPDLRGELLKSMARLLLQVLGVEKEKEAEDDPR
jgi:hypothetical protein